jgi:hypothetical protein
MRRRSDRRGCGNTRWALSDPKYAGAETPGRTVTDTARPSISTGPFSSNWKPRRGSLATLELIYWLAALMAVTVGVLIVTSVADALSQVGRRGPSPLQRLLPSHRSIGDEAQEWLDSRGGGL